MGPRSGKRPLLRREGAYPRPTRRSQSRSATGPTWRPERAGADERRPRPERVRSMAEWGEYPRHPAALSRPGGDGR